MKTSQFCWPKKRKKLKLLTYNFWIPYRLHNSLGYKAELRLIERWTIGHSAIFCLIGWSFCRGRSCCVMLCFLRRIIERAWENHRNSIRTIFKYCLSSYVSYWTYLEAILPNWGVALFCFSGQGFKFPLMDQRPGNIDVHDFRSFGTLPDPYLWISIH